MVKEVYGEEVMSKFLEEVLAEQQEGGKGGYGWFNCGFCPILWPAAVSIAAVEFGLAHALLCSCDYTKDQLYGLAEVLRGASDLEAQAAHKLHVLCKCNCACEYGVADEPTEG